MTTPTKPQNPIEVLQKSRSPVLSTAYFHFTMPENNYQQMTDAFKEYGQLKIAKEKHERIMPEGIVRVIITVDEKK